MSQRYISDYVGSFPKLLIPFSGVVKTKIILPPPEFFIICTYEFTGQA